MRIVINEAHTIDYAWSKVSGCQYEGSKSEGFRVTVHRLNCSDGDTNLMATAVSIT